MSDFAMVVNVNFVATSLVAGLLGGLMMLLVMRFMTLAGLFSGERWSRPRRNMVVAVGGLLTKSRARAFRVGLLAHAISAVVFAMLYLGIIRGLGATGLPKALMLGTALGLVHGLLVSLALVWAAEGHPFEEYRDGLRLDFPVILRQD